MVCMSSSADAPRVIRAGARIAGRLGAALVRRCTSRRRSEAPGRIKPQDRDALARNIALAESLGATVVRVKADRPADGLIAFAQARGHHPRDLRADRALALGDVLRGSTLNRFLEEVRDAAVQVVPLDG